MDSIAAKRILIALSRKLGYENVRRCNCNRGFTLTLTKKNAKNHIVVRPIGTDYMQDTSYFCTSSKWTNILNALIGKEIRTLSYSNTSPNIVVHSPEQLAIDLELQGFLKNM